MNNNNNNRQIRPAPPAAAAAAGIPEIQHARNYVARVKSSLGAASPQYRLFLATLKSYRTRVLTPQEVIQRISELFRGQRDLILGFNAFLPPEYQILEEGLDDHVPAMVGPMENHDGHVEDGNGHVPHHHVGLVADDNVDHEPAASTAKMVMDDDKHNSDDGKEEDNGARCHDAGGRHPRDHEMKKAPPQDDPMPPRSSRKRLRVRVALSKDVSKNIKHTSYAVTSPSNPSPAGHPSASTATATATNKKHNNKLNTTTTQIILSPPNLQPSDVLHTYNPIQDGELSMTYNIHNNAVNCKLCHGKRDAVAMARNEPVLLCEQKGCNAEYHLGCLYNYRPSIFPKKNGKNDSNVDDGIDDATVANVAAPSKHHDDTNNEHPPQSQSQPSSQLEIPPGDIFCTTCHTAGATSVLEKYLDKIDYERSHYSCNRAYVTLLLEKHMRENPSGGKNADERSGSLATQSNKDGIVGDKVRLMCPPRSELWYAHELDRQASLLGTEEGKEKEDGEDNDSIPINDSAEFLVGKPVRLYNNLDNEYHVGRIVDWRTCTVYPPLYTNHGNSGNLPVSKNNTVHMNDLEYYGIGPLSTMEFLVRFPSGLQGRKKELLRWIMLEEHSLAVGVSLIQGKTAKIKGGGGNHHPNNNGCGLWKPAMILARSALELVTVRQFLHEDEQGNLFANMKAQAGKKKPPSRSSNASVGGINNAAEDNKDDRWALASFFGEEQHALLRLRDEARHLLVDVVAVDDSVNSTSVSARNNGRRNGVISKEEGEEKDGQSTNDDTQTSPSEEGDDNIQPLLCREPLASVDVPLGLALAEHSEQQRCKEWCQLLLQKSDHKRALISCDEYSIQLHLDTGSLSAAMTVVQNGIGSSVLSKSDQEEEVVSAGNGTNSSSNGIQPLVERGMDRLWLARLVKTVSSYHDDDDDDDEPTISQRWSKDTLMSFQCEKVSSVANAMASLQQRQ